MSNQKIVTETALEAIASDIKGALALKADKSTTYTKTETDGLLNAKADKSTTYTKTEIDTKLLLKEQVFGSAYNNTSAQRITGKLYNIVTKSEITYSPGNYSVLENLNSGDILSLTGMAWGSNELYPFYAFFDNNDDVIEYFGEADKGYNNYLVIVPSGAVKLIVSGNSTFKSLINNFNQRLLSSELDELAQAVSNGLVWSEITDSQVVVLSRGLVSIIPNQSYSSGYHITVNATNLRGKLVNVSGATAYFTYGTVGYCLAIVYDSNDNIISYYGAETLKTYKSYGFIVPSNAAKIVVNYNGNDTPKIYTLSNPALLNSIWNSKKIGVLGTSVAFGANATTSYSLEASKLLSFNLSMFGVPGLAIETNSDGTPKTYGSFTCSKAEYAAAGVTIANAPITPYEAGGNYNNYYTTYQNVFNENNADIDLWIYAVLPNNEDFSLDDWNAFNKSAWKYNDDSAFSEHRKTFIGALLFIMDQMYTLNPEARMVFVVDSSFSYSGGLPVLETVANYWNIPIINLWGKINTSPKSLTKLKSLDGTNNHPSTFAHQIMGKMLSGELNTIS